ncbi:MAG: NusG domain II-containing protein [Clostridium sp.]
MKKWDFIIIVLVLIISAIGFIFISKMQSKDYSEKFVEITLDGKLLKTIDITDKNYSSKFSISNESYVNEFIIENGTIRIISANCSDEVCVKSGSIGKVGETIVCLPHRLIVEVRGIEESGLDDISK